MLKFILKKIFPSRILALVTGCFYGWHGNYSSWEEANNKCTGYDSQIIFAAVRNSMLKVRNGSAAYERDSVLFDEVQYSFPVLSGLMWIAAQNSGRINVLDFGGSLGSSYFQNKQFLLTLKEINWCIVEQPQFVNTGINEFADSNLHFFYSIDECLESYQIDIVLISSVLQYIKQPFALLDEIFSKNIKYIIIDRTHFLKKGNDRITIQKVPRKIYRAKYCCWFFNKPNFLNYFRDKYELILDFNLNENVNIKSDYQGFIFRKLE